MNYTYYGYVLEYKKVTETSWKSCINDEMGVCYKTMGGAQDAVRRLKGVFNEKEYIFRIFPIYSASSPEISTKGKISLESESHIY